MTKLELDLKKDNVEYLKLMSLGIDKDISTVVDGIIDYIAYFLGTEMKNGPSSNSLLFYAYVNGSLSPPKQESMERLRKEIFKDTGFKETLKDLLKKDDEEK